MSLRLKFGLSEVTRMSVELESTVSAAVKNALVEGDWVVLSSVGGISGVPSGSGGVGLKCTPVGATPKRNSYPIIVNPQSPENSIPGVGLTVACEKGFIGYTDRYDPGQAYADVPLVAKSFVVGGVTRYGLFPADVTGLVEATEITAVVAHGIGIYNNELVFRYLP